MKKFLVFIGVLFVIGASMPVINVKADDEKVDIEAEIVDIEVETEEDFKDAVSGWLSQYMETDLVAKIIGWLVDCGVLGALFGVYLKYKKYKHTTVEDVLIQQKDLIEKAIKEKFDTLGAGEIKSIVDAISKLEQSNETIMKVLVLAQDSTTKGKIALIDYLGSKTNSEEVKEASEQVQVAIEEKQKEKDEIIKQYENVF